MREWPVSEFINKISPKLLHGVWRLERFEQRGSDGLMMKSHPNSKGLLIYTESGAMSVSMDRQLETSDPDIERNFIRHLYYAGTYKLEGDLILHRVEIALQDQHRNQVLPRRAQLEDGNQLLILEALSIEQKVLGTIVWRLARS